MRFPRPAVGSFFHVPQLEFHAGRRRDLFYRAAARAFERARDGIELQVVAAARTFFSAYGHRIAFLKIVL